MYKVWDTSKFNPWHTSESSCEQWPHNWTGLFYTCERSPVQGDHQGSDPSTASRLTAVPEMPSKDMVYNLNIKIITFLMVKSRIIHPKLNKILENKTTGVLWAIEHELLKRVDCSRKLIDPWIALILRENYSTAKVTLLTVKFFRPGTPTNVHVSISVSQESRLHFLIK